MVQAGKTALADDHRRILWRWTEWPPSLRQEYRRNKMYEVNKIRVKLKATSAIG